MTDRDAVQDSGAKAARRAAIALVILVAAVIGLFVANPHRLYLWIKAVHVIAIIAWMAAMLYLPRLFIYHCDAEAGSAQSETFKVMERRLLRIIANPAMMIAWVLGIWLAWTSGVYLDGWFIAKLLCVLAMSAVHGHFAKAVRLFAEDRNERPARYWRMMNEAPTVLMIVIVVMVIVRPF
ncbi:MAG TPA: protoporphyrinogen oxidase HemJ [Rhizobiaceae bacterium]|nr:protoporphyrinogen oxidase HemJ [Rhizobiaceae bacterium]